MRQQRKRESKITGTGKQRQNLRFDRGGLGPQRGQLPGQLQGLFPRSHHNLIFRHECLIPARVWQKDKPTGRCVVLLFSTVLSLSTQSPRSGPKFRSEVHSRRAESCTEPCPLTWEWRISASVLKCQRHRMQPRTSIQGEEVLAPTQVQEDDNLVKRTILEQCLKPGSPLDSLPHQLKTRMHLGQLDGRRRPELN